MSDRVTDKKKVKQRWPNVRVQSNTRAVHRQYRIYGGYKVGWLSDLYDDEADAWADAARRLEAESDH